MDKEQINISFILLSWARAYRDLQQNSDIQEEFKQNLEKLDEYLAKHNINNIVIINKSEDYYTLSYTQDGQTRIKQFTTEEVEKHI